MILQGFEIENWSCIKKVSVTGLPATGVIVLHGPNRTGKSSIVQALRSCLMDYPSTTAALKSYYPRGTGEKPVVTVTFQAGGTSYRITKQFGTNKSKLESKTPEGAWKVETTTSAEGHERTCGYAGGNDSAKGLHQLLWLTQAEFQLPDAKKFDSNVQAQLRGILGVLQTPLDDRFIERVGKRWNTWYSGQRKAGKQQEIKDSCKLAENLKKLEADQKGLQDSEGKFHEVEGLLRQAAELESQKLDLERQLADQTRELQARREEYQRSQAHIEARRRAEDRQTFAVNELAASVQEHRQRAEAAQRCSDDEKAVEPAQTKVNTVGPRVIALEQKLGQLRKALGAHREQRGDLQDRANRVAAKLRKLVLAEQLTAAQRDCEHAQNLSQEIARIQRYFADHPALDELALKALRANRQRASRLRADHEAASMNLTLDPETGASPTQLAIDGGTPRDLPISGEPILRAARRKAEMLIAGWGRVELSRGTGSANLDQIESDLRQCDEEFANTVTPLGISATDPQALDLLVDRASEHRLRNPDLDTKRKELEQLAPEGVGALHTKVVGLRTKLADGLAIGPPDAERLPAEQGELDKLADDLKQQIEAKDRDIKTLETDLQQEDTKLTTERQEATIAREELATCKAKANKSREELERLPTDEQISQRVQAANRALEDAQSQLTQTELTDDERTINQRLEAVDLAVSALERQIRDNASKYDVIKGRLLESEGLHARRSSLAARVDELTRITERESLEKDAVDRLYALFDECREKQLGTLMGPIHDRVLGWMRVLDFGDYKEVRFNDAFLPDKLMSRDGTSEFTIGEESTGAQEQIGMLVRLALGSILSSAAEPAVAILDDPLTHCDTGRLNKMRVILRRAAEGDQKPTPPAGPLQIIILTCHPEWFRDERATVIDLQSAEVMSRWPV
jgi:DNA repair exonuclease SbcCD ATPase subunit